MMEHLWERGSGDGKAGHAASRLAPPHGHPGRRRCRYRLGGVAGPPASWTGLACARADGALPRAIRHWRGAWSARASSPRSTRRCGPPSITAPATRAPAGCLILQPWPSAGSAARRGGLPPRRVHVRRSRTDHTYKTLVAEMPHALNSVTARCPLPARSPSCASWDGL